MAIRAFNFNPPPIVLSEDAFRFGYTNLSMSADLFLVPLTGATDPNFKINARGGADTVLTGNGTDSIFGGTGTDNLSGGGGHDTIFGGSHNDTINGGADDDRLYGGSGDDIINGGAGADRIEGGLGKDTISGGDGNDVIISGPGHDILSGGNQSDTFVFSIASGLDIVGDFVSGVDKIDLPEALEATLPRTPFGTLAREGLVTFIDGETDAVRGNSPVLIWDADVQSLAYDADGLAGHGTPDPLAVLEGVFRLSVHDFQFETLFN